MVYVPFNSFGFTWGAVVKCDVTGKVKSYGLPFSEIAHDTRAARITLNLIRRFGSFSYSLPSDFTYLDPTQ